MDAIAESLKQSRARSSCAVTPTPIPTSRRPTTTGACRRRARKWPITCSTAPGWPRNAFERIEGYADQRLKDPAHPFAAENRRIEILLQEATQ